MMLTIPVPIEDEWTNLPPVSHAPVADPYPSNIHIRRARSCLLDQLVWLFPCHLQSLVVCHGSSLKRDSYRRDSSPCKAGLLHSICSETSGDCSDHEVGDPARDHGWEDTRLQGRYPAEDPDRQYDPDESGREVPEEADKCSAHS